MTDHEKQVALSRAPKSKPKRVPKEFFDGLCDAASGNPPAWLKEFESGEAVCEGLYQMAEDALTEHRASLTEPMQGFGGDK